MGTEYEGGRKEVQLVYCMVELATENCLWEFGILAWGWEMWMLFCKKIINEHFWYRYIETVVKNYLIQLWVCGMLKNIYCN